MRIGIDIDDTICDTLEFVLPYCCKYYGINYSEVKDYPISYFIDNYGYYDFAKKYYGKIMPYVPLKKDVVKYLDKLKKRGHQIIFITARSNRGYDNPYQLTYDYLVKNNVPFDTLITDAEKKDLACIEEEIEIYIDDDLNNCMAVSNKGIKTYLICKQKNKNLKIVKNFKQIYKLIKKEEKNGRRKSSNKS